MMMLPLGTTAAGPRPAPPRALYLDSSQSDLVMLSDEGDYPGGDVQRFRVLKKQVEALLEG